MQQSLKKEKKGTLPFKEKKGTLPFSNNGGGLVWSIKACISNGWGYCQGCD
jgi:hypothetical protein